MSYLALYRKWRPLVFEDVVEQEHVVRTLRNSICSGRIAHAYLFCGTRGTGKTTMAKIFSRAVNCLNPKDGDPCNQCEICQGILNGSLLDVIEIDAASNNSVDDIRVLRDEVIYTPSKARYKVYIIDEVHMLSTGAFNALLKTLEEPPAHVIFILATTEPHKLPATILSRCQRFDFRRIPVDSIVKRIEYIAKESGVEIRREASKLIAKLSDGALRDAISILDQCISLGSKELTYEDVLSVVGLVTDTFIAEVVDAIKNKEVGRVLNAVDELVMEGKNIGQFVSELVMYYRNLMICSSVSNPEDIIDASADSIQRMKEQCKGLELFEIVTVIKELSSLEAALKWSTHPRVLLETTLIKLCENRLDPGDAGVLERIRLLEKNVNDILEKGVAIPQNGSDGSGGSQKDSGSVDSDEKNSSPEVNERIEKKNIAKNVKGIEVWGKVLDELKSRGRMAVYAYLLDTKLIELGSNQVGIVFKNNGCKMLVEKSENLEVIEECLRECLGKEVRVKCFDEEDIVDTGKNDEEDKLVEKAQDFAQKFDVEVNIIDE
ncbi:DNA polymerase-3 subunit gamma/tau [Acetivibrio thermocellus AD2]|uniref:DNA-directed DNA polymerase n=1 Tax=Acetivibrio thermocellus AD2 TaxID=1138384 RepID=A0AB36TJM3_ACETH|nr:DNA polymerase III subunit gamma/tau [Acetivibrio thermocellus]CDG36661.1 DNA polymerase III, subunits gamma and tau [Acetivibrio thermocellus BC1]ADU75783.1 DNA polymerase III, subunits gamma and tau [Acetivibrio thermocellus DSM 1313]ALX09814.1 DNA polymerase III, subunits gamma and tau [Acetivibrio thermocellus AD2]ANV77588.1 DNA polymerase III, subunits gamma and tau [Acetivibrio thermocellus DSM 2360]EIC03671.1 DNA polymerase III, subunits gamma and tau [Acetivibrio thermocellus YS]